MKKVVVSKLTKGQHIGFNAGLTINPSLRHLRDKKVPMTGEVKAIEGNEHVVTVETMTGTILVVPASSTFEVIPEEKQDKPETPKEPTTFEGKSIE